MKNNSSFKFPVFDFDFVTATMGQLVFLPNISKWAFLAKIQNYVILKGISGIA
jgi:hypothetical protein